MTIFSKVLMFIYFFLSNAVLFLKCYTVCFFDNGKLRCSLRQSDETKGSQYIFINKVMKPEFQFVFYSLEMWCLIDFLRASNWSKNEKIQWAEQIESCNNGICVQSSFFDATNMEEIKQIHLQCLIIRNVWLL